MDCCAAAHNTPQHGGTALVRPAGGSIISRLGRISGTLGSVLARRRQRQVDGSYSAQSPNSPHSVALHPSLHVGTSAVSMGSVLGSPAAASTNSYPSHGATGSGAQGRAGGRFSGGREGEGAVGGRHALRERLLFPGMRVRMGIASGSLAPGCTAKGSVVMDMAKGEGGGMVKAWSVPVSMSARVWCVRMQGALLVL